MPKRDPRIDAYIENSADFAKPILKRFRQAVHKACPDVEESIKWRMAAFSHHGLMCGIASFKAHCAIMFWKYKLLFGEQAPFAAEGMGQFGKIASIKDMPSEKQLVGYIKQAAELNETGAKVVRAPARKRALTVPTDLSGALKKNKRALATFEKLPPSHKREYIEWITEAKREETRTKRLAQAVEWMAEGKSRNWKYENC
jgi:uncharacterized protein YdeI (YjbR/CyaY-like superfamily)